MLVYHFHLSKASILKVKPFLDNQTRGVFATRSPNRPNPIGISVVRLAKVEGNILHIKDLDILDGSPLLDIKPFIPEIDTWASGKIGWLEKNVHRFPTSKDDGRFREG
jgi:tRNA-Thr(GGU) m(6)t(6)A37 methyltransferase TsaA